MNIAIDRKVDHDVFWGFQETEFFENSFDLPSPSPDYRQMVASSVPSDWKVGEQDVWLHAAPPDAQIPPQGFKIHISATSLNAMELLRRVVPVCVDNQTAFKALADPFLVEVTTSKNYSRGGSGKFMTIYPRDDQHFVRLLEKLDKATNGLTGPYILSDKRYRDNQVLFYRYGAFTVRDELNIFGEKVPVISASDGRLVPDIRTPYFQLPDGIADPFESESLKESGEARLNNRYLVQEALVHSNVGGVYRAEDQLTGHSVIIKEARPHINVTRHDDQDAIATLKKEARVLEKLGHTGYAPKLVDFFQEWEHFFLVEEFVEGIELSSYRARTDVGLIVQRHRTDDSIKRFCERLYSITASLIEALQAFHLAGVIMGDLSPRNIIINPETLDLKIIDFEAASLLDEPSTSDILMFTPGFVSPNRRAGAKLSPEDDFYALGSVIYSFMLPVQGFFQLNPGAADLFIDELTRDFRLPQSVKEMIFALLQGEVDRARTIVERSGLTRVELPPAAIPGNPKRSEISETIEAISGYIVSKADTKREDRLWPSDYRLFATNPLSVAYGAVGTALFLKAALGRLPEDSLRWLDRQPLSLEAYAPGLFAGLSGVAWGFEELGLTEKARTAIELAYQSPLLSEGPDVFYGTAGVGLASLYFFKRTGEERFLQKACEFGNSIVAKASSDENGCYWTNVDGVNYFGYCHGGSGIALFLLYLYRATGDARYLSYATGGIDYEIAHARIDDDTAAWDRAKGDSLEVPYWRFGAAGVGSALIRFASILGRRSYRELAEKAGNYCVGKYAVFPGQLSGLSGIGEFLIDLYHFTGEQKYLNDAYKIAQGVLLFQIKRPEGIAFPGEELLRISTDYGTGSAGVGMFLRRLIQPGGRLFYELEP